MKLAVIGGSGLIGSTTAFMTAKMGVFEEIRLLGRRENMLKSHVMDMEQAIIPFSKTKISAAETDGLSGCDAVFIAVSINERGIVNREEGITANSGLISQIAENIKRYAPEAVTLIATNPVDAFNYFLYKKIGGERGHYLGFGTNDSLRLRWAAAKRLALDFNRLQGFCIGEHGPTQVPLFSSLEYDGNPLSVSDAERAEIESRLFTWFGEFQSLKSGRTSGWTSGVAASGILADIATDSGRIDTVSVPLDGEYGQSDVSAGIAAHIGKNGAKPVVIDITDGEKKALEASVLNIKRQIDLVFESGGRPQA